MARTEFAERVREGLRHLQSKEPDLVASALDDQLHNGSNLSPTEFEKIEHTVGEITRGYETNMPGWVNRDGLLLAACKLSSAEFYSNVLESTTPSIRDHITMGYDVADAAFSISVNNAKFMTQTIYTALLAALQGDAVTYVKDFTVPITKRFPTQVATPDEFIGRIRELVPNPEEVKLSNSPTLLDYLKTDHAFRGYSGRVCPAIPFTGIVLNQWGRQLASDNAYNARLRQLISNNPNVNRTI